MTEPRPIPGATRDLMAQTRALRRQATALRTSARSVSRTVAGHTSTWSGTASICYASQAGQHHRAVTAGAGSLERTSTSTDNFARELGQLQGQASRHLQSYDRLQSTLRTLLRDQRIEWRILTPAERTELANQIADTRRRITWEENAIARLAGEYQRLCRRFQIELGGALPAAVRRLFEVVPHDWAAINAGTGGLTAVGAVGYLRALQRAGTVDPRKERTAYRAGQKAMAKLANFKGGVPSRIVQSQRLSTWVKTPAGRVVSRFPGPVGIVTLEVGAFQDVRTGGGYSGGRAVSTRVLAGGAMVGGALLLTTVATPVGVALVGAYGAWTLGNYIYDRRNNIDRALHRMTGRSAHGVGTLTDDALKQVTDLPEAKPVAGQQSETAAEAGEGTKSAPRHEDPIDRSRAPGGYDPGDPGSRDGPGEAGPSDPRGAPAYDGRKSLPGHHHPTQIRTAP